MQLIHLGTQIQSVFGRLDEQGNVVERYAVAPNEGKPVDIFSLEAFQQSHFEICKVKADLQNKMNCENLKTKA